jgi:hypothetical protein
LVRRFTDLICADLLREVAPDHPDVLSIRRAIRRHNLMADVRIVAVAVVGIALLYLLSLPVRSVPPRAVSGRALVSSSAQGSSPTNAVLACAAAAFTRGSG